VFVFVLPTRELETDLSNLTRSPLVGIIKRSLLSGEKSLVYNPGGGCIESLTNQIVSFEIIRGYVYLSQTFPQDPGCPDSAR